VTVLLFKLTYHLQLGLMVLTCIHRYDVNIMSQY